MSSTGLPSQRQIRFGEVIRSIISETLIRGSFFNSDIDISTTIVSFVKMSKDLKMASIYFTPLGGKNKENILKFLNDNKFVFQKNISRAKLKSKFTPKITFYLDNSFEEVERIENLLNKKKVLKDIRNE